MPHEENRQKLYSEIENFWHDLNGIPYALYDVYPMTSEKIREVKWVTERIAAVYDKTAEILRRLPDESLLDLGIPKRCLPFLREKALLEEAVIRRIDLVMTQDGWKHYEMNADTPTFIKECHHVNGIVARHFGFHDANGGCEDQLVEAIRNAIILSHKGKHFPKVVFTAHSDHVEDWYTSCYLGELSGLPHENVCLKDLRIVKDVGLFTPGGEKIDVLYRQTYPVEFMVEDVSEQGTLVGVELMRLIQQRKLAVLNPLSAFILQSKGVQAVIWNLHQENHPYFTVDEHNIIENHFIPTYFEKDIFLEKGVKFVEKPVFGREGDTVVIYDENGAALNENPLKTYDVNLKIYQEYTELPVADIMTPNGVQKFHLLFGSFIIGKEAGAIGIRAGEAITGNESCFLPVGIVKQEGH